MSGDDNPADYNAGYHLFEAGFIQKPAQFVKNIIVKFSFERLAAERGGSRVPEQLYLSMYE